MAALRLMMPIWFRVPGLLLLVGLAAGCGQERGSEPTKAVDELVEDRGREMYFENLDRGSDAVARKDYPRAVKAFTLAAKLAWTDIPRSMALALQSMAEVMAGRAEAALETTRRSEIALRRSGRDDHVIQSIIFRVRAQALYVLGRLAEARDMGAQLYIVENSDKARQDTSVAPDGEPVPHDELDMAFLPRIGDLQLRKISRTNPGILSMTGHYGLVPPLDRTEGPFKLSISVTRSTPGHLRNELSIIVRALQIDIADARVIEPAHPAWVAASDGTRASGWRAVLIAPSLNTYTEVALFKVGKAMVSVRASYAILSADAMVPRIRTFLDNFDWPSVDPPGRKRH